jgi:hypothetical protein
MVNIHVILHRLSALFYSSGQCKHASSGLPPPNSIVKIVAIEGSLRRVVADAGCISGLFLSEPPRMTRAPSCPARIRFKSSNNVAVNLFGFFQ